MAMNQLERSVEWINTPFFQFGHSTMFAISPEWKIQSLYAFALQFTLVSLCWEIRVPRLSHPNRCTALFARFHCTRGARRADWSLIYNTPQGDIQPLKSGERSLAGRILIDPPGWNNSLLSWRPHNTDSTMCTGQRFMTPPSWRIFKDRSKNYRPRSPPSILASLDCFFSFLREWKGVKLIHRATAQSTLHLRLVWPRNSRT